MNDNNAWSVAMEGGVDQSAYSIGKQRLWRKGKWTDEEERYTKRLVSAFNQGLLPLQVGTTLRCFLSDKLNCDPMRISKKFAGSSSIGKQVYTPCDPTSASLELMKIAQEELRQLETSFLAKVEVSEKPFMNPTPPQMPIWYQGNAPFVYGVTTEYMPTMPTMVMGVPYNGIPEGINPPRDIYMHVGLPQQIVPITIPITNNPRPPPPEPKEPRRNFVVPEMKQIQEAKQVLESKPDVKETDSKETETKQVYVYPTSSQAAEVIGDLAAPPVVAEARVNSSLTTQSQDRQQPEILEIPPLIHELNAPRAQPKYNMAHKKSLRPMTSSSHTGTDSSDSDLLINFFKAANDRDSVETNSDSSSNNSKSLERKSDSTHINSGSEEKSSTESSHNSSGNSGSDGDNSSQEEESSGTQDKSESSSQEGGHRSRNGRGKGTMSPSESDQAASAPTSTRPQHPHNRRYFHSQQPTMAPYPGHPPTYFHHGPTPYSPYPASVPGFAQYPQMPIQSMQPMPGPYGMYPQPMPGVMNPNLQLQQQVAMARHRSGNYHRSRTASSSGSISSGSESGAPNGTVVDTPKGPMLIWHEVNSKGILVEKAVEFAFMTAPYRAGKVRPSNTTQLTEEQLRALQMARSRRESDRTERRNTDSSNSNKRLRTADGGNTSSHMDCSEMSSSSSPT